MNTTRPIKMETNMKIEDVVVDLETLGTVPGCGILAIGAVSLDLRERFYEKISPPSNRSFRLFTEKDTLDWWDKQSDEARNESFGGTLSLDTVLNNFSIWLKSLSSESEKIRVWGNGADFDVPILRVAYKEAAIECPVGKLSARCYRTLKEEFPDVKKPPFVGERHTAIADARFQAEHLKLLLNLVTKRR